MSKYRIGYRDAQGHVGYFCASSSKVWVPVGDEFDLHRATQLAKHLHSLLGSGPNAMVYVQDTTTLKDVWRNGAETPYHPSNYQTPAPQAAAPGVTYLVRADGYYPYNTNSKSAWHGKGSLQRWLPVMNSAQAHHFTDLAEAEAMAQWVRDNRSCGSVSVEWSTPVTSSVQHLPPGVSVSYDSKGRPFYTMQAGAKDKAIQAQLEAIQAWGVPPTTTTKAFQPAPPCSGCGMRNPDAEANRPDGSYRCYECRTC